MSDWPFDEEYLRKLAARDPEVEQHFTAYFSSLLRMKLRKRLRSPEHIEDIRQETFLRVLKTLNTGNGIHSPERLGAFVNGVCNRVLLEDYRTSQKHRPLPDDAPERADERPSPADLVVTAEDRARVRQVLAALKEKDREILKQIFLDERNKDEICKELGINQEYLRVLIHRAKSKFRNELRRKEEDGVDQSSSRL